MNKSLIGHKSVVAQLEKEKKYSVTSDVKSIFLTRRFAKSLPVTLRLDRDDEKEGYVLRPCVYTFRSSNSYFDYCVDEDRFTRNKETIKSFLRTFQSSFIWEYVINKDDYLKVNHFNVNSKKQTVAKQLQEVLQK